MLDLMLITQALEGRNAELRGVFFEGGGVVTPGRPKSEAISKQWPRMDGINTGGLGRTWTEALCPLRNEDHTKGRKKKKKERDRRTGKSPKEETDHPHPICKQLPRHSNTRGV